MSDLIQRDTADDAIPRSQETGEIAAPAVQPISYDYDGKGNIVLPDGVPFDGEPVLIKLAAGWCEAWWEPARQFEGADGIDSDGFCWCCMDDQFQAELDDAKFWTAMPTANTQEHSDGNRI